MNRIRYVGPMNQLRGKTGMARVTKSWEMVPPGFLAVQFDQLGLTVDGVSMAHGWHLVKTNYCKGQRE